jgi:hypothetical protein
LQRGRLAPDDLQLPQELVLRDAGLLRISTGAGAVSCAILRRRLLLLLVLAGSAPRAGTIAVARAFVPMAVVGVYLVECLPDARGEGRLGLVDEGSEQLRVVAAGAAVVLYPRVRCALRLERMDLEQLDDVPDRQVRWRSLGR